MFRADHHRQPRGERTSLPRAGRQVHPRVWAKNDRCLLRLLDGVRREEDALREREDLGAETKIADLEEER